ncbi:MAG: DUF1501 domain-containing protein [Thermaurantiacus sp.]
MLSRRSVLGGTAAGFLSFACAPGMVLANADTDMRFVYLILRGGMDGLEALMPVGDPTWPSLFGRQDPLGEPLPLNAFFHLHSNLRQFGPLLDSGELVFVHAIASPYRERSHFDAQNIIETGGRRAYELRQGWLTRLVSELGGGASRAVAISRNLPVSLHGDIPFGNYANARLEMPSSELRPRLARLWAGDDDLSGTWEQTQKAARILAGAGGGGQAGLAAHMLSHPEGPRIAVLSLGGFDTHSSQKYRLGNVLRDVEGVIMGLRRGLGPHWSKTVVVAATEFGRTVAMSGASGTEHGTATAAFVAGGALTVWGVKGPVIADWPGLRAQDLHEHRDLKPTRDLRSLLLAVTARHFGADPDRLGPALFPGPDRVRPDPAFI